MKLKLSRYGIVAGLIGGLTGPLLVRAYPPFLGICLAIIIAALAAAACSWLYFKYGKFNTRLLTVLFWSNTVAWFIPIVGFFVASLTGDINRRNTGSDARRYNLLAAIGMLLSLAHIVARIQHIVTW